MRLKRLVLLLLIAALPASQVAAEDWHESAHARVRLIAAGEISAERIADRTGLTGPLLLAGVEIQLDAGWKTYWRTPGDGIAPQFDWSGSQNLAQTQVLWPVPAHFRDMAGEYNGYADHVMLPIVVVPQQPAEPVTLALSLDYAVCMDVCIPVRKSLSLLLSADEAGGRDVVLAALRHVPVRAQEQTRCGALVLEAVDARLDGPSPRLEISFTHPAHASPDDLFVEAETGQFLPHPKRIEAAPERTVFHLDPGAGGDPRALIAQALTLTVVAAPQSCEMTWTVE
jgi:DsbC/DsbD-like thiol-disulfide interchange protein